MIGILESVCNTLHTPGNAELQNTDISVDNVYSVLSNERRREILHAMADTESGVVSVGALADHLAECGHDRQSARVSIHQCHLPKMDSMSVVQYDREAKLVRRGEAFDAVVAVQDAVADQIDCLC